MHMRFYGATLWAQNKNEANLILVLMLLDHFRHSETNQIISRTQSLIFYAIMRVINNDCRNFALKLSSKLPTFLLKTLVIKVHITFFLRVCILSRLWLLSTKIWLEKLNVAFLRVNNFIKYWKMKKKWKNIPHFKHIIYNMTSLTILQSSYTIFWSIGYIRYIKLPSLLPQSMSVRAARAPRKRAAALLQSNIMGPRAKMRVTWF